MLESADMNCTRLAALLCLLATTLCAQGDPFEVSFAPARADDVAQETGARYSPGQGRWGERTLIDVSVLAGFWAKIDENDQTSPGSTADSAEGYGVAARIGVGNRDQSVGLLYHGGFLEVSGTNVEVNVHALYADFDITVPLAGAGNRFYFTAGGGLGVAIVEFDSRYDDAVSGAGCLHLGLEFEISKSIGVDFEFGGFLWGHPGDTEAFGSFLDLGLRFTF